MAPRIEVLALEDIDEVTLTVLHAEDKLAFSAEDYQPYLGYKFTESDRCVFVYEGDEWASSIWLPQRTIRVGGEDVFVGGLSGVMTRTAYKGRGYASMAVERANRWICKDINAEFGLLICLPRLVGFYEKHGWKLIDEPMWFSQPDSDGLQKLPPPIQTMILQCGERAWPDGQVDMRGFPW